ncbi:MAG: V-type ATP synthase subunit F [Acidobacteriia bacterium]|nr:V-type ATP synthase subunit F [Terriglobia bacterium]
MPLLVLGDADDARGFRLAGVKALACGTERDLDRAIRDLVAAGGEPGSVVLVSEAVRRLSPAAIDALTSRPGWPMVVVMPESENAKVKSEN